MPFYFMPTLGGNDTLRGFREYRFRGTARDPGAGRIPLGDLERLRRGPLLRRREGRRTVVKISISRISNRTTASGSGSTPTTASSSASMPRSGAAMANTCISSLAAFSKRAAARGRGRVRRGGSRSPVSSACFAAGAVASPRSASPRFYPDDPLWTDDDRALDASKAGSIEDSNGYDFVVNTVGHPGERRDVRALNVNTVDEVPDSSWFTNRIGRKELTVGRNRERAGSHRASDPRRLEGLRRERAAACSPDSA